MCHVPHRHRWLLICLALLLACARAESAPPIIELRGDGKAIGAEHGKALGDQIRALRESYLLKIINTTPKRPASRAAAAVFETKMLPEHQAEVNALADATQVDSADIMLGQCFLDLMPMTACSTVALPAGPAPGHVARLGRNLDFKGLGVADKNSVVLVYHPSGGRNAFVSIGWPGMIGVLSGMNEHGLTLANMEVNRGARLPTAMPYTLLYRTILEQCR